jgi:hypothetical protein
MHWQLKPLKLSDATKAKLKLIGSTLQKSTDSQYKIKKRDMKKAEYLELIKEIGKEVRANNIGYGRVFSDKRKSTGYQTKIWNVFSKDQNKVAAIAKSIGGDAIKVEVLFKDVIITPKQLF